MMAAEKTDILLIGPPKPVIAMGLAAFNVIKLPAAADREKFFAATAPRLRAIACAATSERIDGPFMSRLPRLEIISSFGVGYDHVDAVWAGAHGITVTNTPDVLTEEVADRAQARRHASAGRLSFAPAGGRHRPPALCGAHRPGARGRRVAGDNARRG